MFVEELRGVVVVVGDDGHVLGGSFEDYGSLGAPDVVVVAVVRCVCVGLIQHSVLESLSCRPRGRRLFLRV